MTPQQAIEKALADNRRAAALAATLDTCPYECVRDRMLDIEIIYGGRAGVPKELAREIGRRIGRRKDYHMLVAWNGLPPGTGTPKTSFKPGIVASVKRLFTGWSKP